MACEKVRVDNWETMPSKWNGDDRLKEKGQVKGKEEKEGKVQVENDWEEKIWENKEEL